jgi:hypothetical protein
LLNYSIFRLGCPSDENRIGSFGVLGFDSTTSGKDDVAAGTTKTVTNSFGLDASTLGNRFTVGFYYTL